VALHVLACLVSVFCTLACFDQISGFCTRGSIPGEISTATLLYTSGDCNSCEPGILRIECCVVPGFIHTVELKKGNAWSSRGEDILATDPGIPALPVAHYDSLGPRTIGLP